MKHRSDIIVEATNLRRVAVRYVCANKRYDLCLTYVDDQGRTTQQSVSEIADRPVITSPENFRKHLRMGSNLLIPKDLVPKMDDPAGSHFYQINILGFHANVVRLPVNARTNFPKDVRTTSNYSLSNVLTRDLSQVTTTVTQAGATVKRAVKADNSVVSPQNIKTPKTPKVPTHPWRKAYPGQKAPFRTIADVTGSNSKRGKSRVDDE